LKDASFNFVQFLQEIASEQKSEVTYVDTEEKSDTGLKEIRKQFLQAHSF
jgi:hypothetical protein